MKKLLVQLLIVLSLFLGVWYLLSQIDYVRIFQIEKFNKFNEQKFGKFIYDNLRKESAEVKLDSGTDVPGVIEKRICQMNGLNPDSIKIHVLQNPEVNAVSIPGHQIIIYTGLIDYCKTPEELAGIMAHETVHITHNHVTKKMMRNLLLLGTSQSRVASELAKDFVATAFDRDQEADADATAIRYLLKAKINPSGFVDFFVQYSKDKDRLPKALVWISTHPDTEKRAENVRKLIPARFDSQSVVSKIKWADFKKAVSHIE